MCLASSPIITTPYKLWNLLSNISGGQKVREAYYMKCLLKVLIGWHYHSSVLGMKSLSKCLFFKDLAITHTHMSI